MEWTSLIIGTSSRSAKCVQFSPLKQLVFPEVFKRFFLHVRSAIKSAQAAAPGSE